MAKHKYPTHTSHWFITLDDGEFYVTDPILVLVTHHGILDGVFQGATVEFANDHEHGLRHFALASQDQNIVMLFKTSVGASGRFSSRAGEHRVSWLQEILPPRHAPKDGDRVGLVQPAVRDTSRLGPAQ